MRNKSLTPLRSLHDRKQRKRDRFVRLAEKRVSNSIKDLRLIGNLSNKSHYEFTDNDVRKILSALTRERESVKAKFKDKGSDDDAIFKL